MKPKKPTRPRNVPPFKTRKLPTSQLAQWGYWAKPIQKTVRKWRDKIGEQWCEHYIGQCVISVTGKQIKVELASFGHKGYVLDLLKAADQVWNDESKPSKWILEITPVGESTTNYRGRSSLRIQELIRQRSGKYFSVDAINQTCTRLRLTDETMP